MDRRTRLSSSRARVTVTLAWGIKSGWYRGCGFSHRGLSAMLSPFSGCTHQDKETWLIPGLTHVPTGCGVTGMQANGFHRFALSHRATFRSSRRKFGLEISPIREERSMRRKTNCRNDRLFLAVTFIVGSRADFSLVQKFIVERDISAFLHRLLRKVLIYGEDVFEAIRSNDHFNPDFLMERIDTLSGRKLFNLKMSES